MPAPYQCAATTYEWIDTVSGQSLGLGDDAQAAVTMPFAWPFYGTPTDQIRIASNGFVRLDGGMATAYDNASIPSASDPNGFIAPFWDDLNPGAGGAVRVGTAGTQPSRRYVVSWEGVPHFNLSGSTLTFQLVFEEATGQVVMNYGDVIAGSASYDGGASATVGIEDPTGGYGTLLSYNRASLTGGTSYRCAAAVGEPAARRALRVDCRRGLAYAGRSATCGLDIEVPAIAWNNSPGTLPASGNGELPARIWSPGAVTSGLMISGATGLGPRELTSVMDGA